MAGKPHKPLHRRPNQIETHDHENYRNRSTEHSSCNHRKSPSPSLPIAVVLRFARMGLCRQRSDADPLWASHCRINSCPDRHRPIHIQWFGG